MGLVFITQDEFKEYQYLKKMTFDKFLRRLDGLEVGYIELTQHLLRDKGQLRTLRHDVVMGLGCLEAFMEEEQLPWDKMSRRLKIVLRHNGILFWGDIRNRTRKEISALRNIGKHTMMELEALMSKAGVSFKEEVA